MATDSKAECLKSNDLIKVHFFYVALILSAIILVLATRDWTKLDGFTDYLSVAATITSLVLGILAIIYSFVSNGAMSQFLGSIEASSRGMREISADLRSVVVSGEQLQARSEKRTDELHEIIGSLRASMDGVASRTSAIEGTVSSFPMKLSELREAIEQRSLPTQSTGIDAVASAILNADVIKAFLASSSLLGFMAIKAVVDAKMIDRYCDLKKIFDEPEFSNFEYVYGYLIASSALFGREFEFIDDETMSDGRARLSIVSDELNGLVVAELARRKAAAKESDIKILDNYVALIGQSMVEAPGK